MTEAAQAMELAHIDAALTLNAEITPLHPTEAVYKTAVAVYGGRWAKGNYTLTGADSLALNAIAFESPKTHGEGVDIARMLLDTLVAEFDPLLRRAAPDEQRTPVETSLISVFPNPTGSFINIKVEGAQDYPLQITLCDLAGRIVLQTYQTFHLQQYSLDYLSSGTCLYTIQNTNGSVVQRDKLLLNKN